MKKVMKYLAMLQLLLLLSGCENEAKNHAVNSNEYFLAQKKHEYTCVTDNGDVIIVEVTDIDDKRSYGIVCSAAFGRARGWADVNVKVKVNKERYSKTLEILGCTGDGEYPPTSQHYPTLNIGDYTLVMTNLYPLSEDQDNAPKSESDYQVKFIIIE